MKREIFNIHPSKEDFLYFKGLFPETVHIKEKFKKLLENYKININLLKYKNNLNLKLQK
jgi:hypothetical protein